MHWDRTDFDNEWGLAVDFRNGAPEERIRHAVPSKWMHGGIDPWSPAATAKSLRLLADWIDWRFSVASLSRYKSETRDGV
jgi:hypothetical protein